MVAGERRQEERKERRDGERKGVGDDEVSSKYLLIIIVGAHYNETLVQYRKSRVHKLVI